MFQRGACEQVSNGRAEDDYYHQTVSDDVRSSRSKRNISGSSTASSSSSSSSESLCSSAGNSASTIVMPQPLLRNKARKSMACHNSTVEKKQLELLKERGLITPKNTLQASSLSPETAYNPVEGTSTDYPTNTVTKETQSSLESEKGRIKRRLLNHIEDSDEHLTECSTSASSHRIPGTGFLVDTFNLQDEEVTAYFLSRFHFECFSSLGLWLDKPIYCSPVTAKLLSFAGQINPEVIKTIQAKETLVIDDVRVTALDSNYCPGSLMFLFKLSNGKQILHTTAFKATDQMKCWPELNASPIDQIFLDTTYCYSGWNPPSKDQIFVYVNQLMQQNLRIHGTKILFVFACKTIATVDLVLLAVKQLRAKVWAPPLKQAIIRCLDYKELSKALVSNPRKAQIHLISRADFNVRNLLGYLSELSPQFSNMLAIHPSGWYLEDSIRRGGDLSKNIQRRRHGNVQLCLLPYSDHSGYAELRSFIQHFRPREIIPTVYGNSEKQRKRMTAIFRRWLQ